MFCSCLNIKRQQKYSDNDDDNISYGDIKISNSSSNHTKDQIDKLSSNSKHNLNSKINNLTKSRGIFNFIKRKKKTKEGLKEELKLQKHIPSTAKGRKIGQKKVNVSSCRSTEQNDDDELDTDGYSKLEEDVHHTRHRYDYPTFLRTSNGIGVTDEHLYASASQTYSFWSEDPYSSIKSVIGDRASGVKGDESSIYEPGYSKIRKIPIQLKSKTTTEPKCASDLYAKIVNQRHKKDANSNNKLNDLPSTSAETSNNNLDNLRKFSLDRNSLLDNQQDSASGSVTSGSQPSYRYLTVRESPRIVRERIRRREEAAAALLAENNENADRSVDERRPEHYYSEINEYESVGGESIYNRVNSEQQITENNEGSTNHNIQNNNNSGTLEMLRLDFGLNGHIDIPPHPPTSPIPKTLPPTTSCSSSIQSQQQSSLISKPSIRRPVVLRMIPPKSLNTVIEEQSNKKVSANGKLSSNGDFSKHIRAVLQPIWANGGSLIGEKKQHKDGETSGHSSLTNSTRASLVEVNTQTAPMPPSRIPVPLSGMFTRHITRRTPSPTRNAAVQTTDYKEKQKDSKIMKKNVKKMLPPPLPAQVGKDYVSPIDLGNDRAWPLKTINQTDEGG